MPQICDKIAAHGTCDRKNCPFSHDTFNCQTCRQVFATAAMFKEHLNFKFHKKKAALEEKGQVNTLQPVSCTVCFVDLADKAQYFSAHSLGKRHRRNMQAQGLLIDPGPELLDISRTQKWCDTCHSNIFTRDWEVHVLSKRHAVASRFNALQGVLEVVEENKNGVIVTPEEVDFGVSPRRHEGRTATLVIHNTNATDVHLLDAHLSSQMTSHATKTAFTIKGQAHDKVLKPDEKVTLKVLFKPEDAGGRYQERIELIFHDPGPKKRFGITRTAIATVGVKEDYAQLKPSRPYVRPQRSTHLEEPVAKITPGVAPPAISEVQWLVRLAPFDPPNELVAMLETAALNGESPSKLAARIRSTMLSSGLSIATHERQLSHLLWIEEDRARRDLSQYDIEDAVLEPHKDVYSKLKVEGLAEKRPSIIVSDRILVKEHGSSVNHWCEGYVHQVLEDEVLLRFHNKFNGLRGQHYHARFALNHLVYRKMHQALNITFAESRVLFPDASHITSLSLPSSTQIDDMRLTDRKIMENAPQLEAVAAILHRPSGSVPFVVFGPPGTGKTVTIVEAIRQLVQRKRTTHILACAPSNSAADLIAQRLAGLGKSQVFRLNAHSRSVDTVPSAVVGLSRVTKESSGFTRFAVPPLDELKRFRVVICTCLSAFIPYRLGVPSGHFTHVFIDEAGQATEPEVMIPIKTTTGPRTNVVISGDSKQLGPIVRSPVARELGLSQSYLDRLMANPVYDEHTGKGLTITKLVKNWRSHPDILKFPNDEFYGGDLVATGDPVMTHSLCGWSGLVRKDFPIIFHGVAGRDEREASSPSFFNIAEASEVKRYVNSLLQDRKLRLKPFGGFSWTKITKEKTVIEPEHIGVISPYHAQVQKIRRLLREKEIKVGSVEEYQGQEKRVIIISTVRSSMEFVKFDLRHTLGFVANPRRFNVAMTRAQALLVVIGDPTVLSLDPLWRKFLNYVSIRGGCTGKRIDWDPTEEVDTTERYDNKRRAEALNALDALIARTKEEILVETEDLGGHEAENVDQPWREDE